MSVTTGQFQSWSPGPLQQWLGHHLGLTDSVGRAATWARSPSSTITLVQDFSDFFGDAEAHTLVFLDNAQATVDRAVSVASPIGFAQSFTFTGVTPHQIIAGPAVILLSATTVNPENHSHALLFNPTGSIVNVDFILGGIDGQLLCIRRAPGSVSNTRVRKGVGNIFGAGNRVLAQASDVLLLFKDGVSWSEMSWQG